jgi:NSS family neurotransmitter:Na+ symporter
MPLLFVLMLILAVKSLTLPGASEGLRFLFHVDFSKINANVFLNALGQAAFSLSAGAGMLITYGSYIKKCNNLTHTAFAVALTDTFIAILAGIIIFPAVFSFGMSPGQGPGLVFVTFPAIFQQMPGGVYFALLFFVLVAIAALTSLVSLLEVVVAFCVEEFKMKRSVATAVTTVLACLLGAFATLSFGPLKHVKILDKSIFDASEFFASNILLPLGAFFVIVFLGWFYDIKQTKDEISNQGTLKIRLFPMFVFIIRYVAPLAILLVFLRGVGLV